MSWSKTINSINKMSINHLPSINCNNISLNLSNLGIPDNSHYATLTLSDYGYSPQRNTTQEDINQFIKFSKELNFLPVIIPDDFSKLPNYFIPKDLIICKQARESLTLEL